MRRRCSRSDRRGGEADRPTAAGLGLGEPGALPVNLDHLSLDAQLALVEQNVSALEGEDLTEPQVSPEGKGHQEPHVLGHRSLQGCQLLEVEQRPLGAVGLAGALDATGVAVESFVGDSRVQDRAQDGVRLPDGVDAGLAPDVRVPLPAVRRGDLVERDLPEERQDPRVQAAGTCRRSAAPGDARRPCAPAARPRCSRRAEHRCRAGRPTARGPCPSRRPRGSARPRPWWRTSAGRAAAHLQDQGTVPASVRSAAAVRLRTCAGSSCSAVHHEQFSGSARSLSTSSARLAAGIRRHPPMRTDTTVPFRSSW